MPQAEVVIGNEQCSRGGMVFQRLRERWGSAGVATKMSADLPVDSLDDGGGNPLRGRVAKNDPPVYPHDHLPHLSVLAAYLFHPLFNDAVVDVNFSKHRGNGGLVFRHAVGGQYRGLYDPPFDVLEEGHGFSPGMFPDFVGDDQLGVGINGQVGPDRSDEIFGVWECFPFAFPF